MLNVLKLSNSAMLPKEILKMLLKKFVYKN
jgi:hypothetical protein